MAAADDDLVRRYREAGVLDSAGAPVHLPTTCPNASSCWQGLEDRAFEPGHPATEISPPWVGEQYAAARVVVVLENLRDFGGFDLRDDPPLRGGKGMRWLVKLARRDLEAGRRRLFRDKTAVWTRAAEYAALWLRMLGVDLEVPAQGQIPSRVLADAFAFFALTQHVKCSPRGNRSRPSEAMWNRCGSHVLLRELRALEPRRLIIVGAGNNRARLRGLVLPGESLWHRDASVLLGKRTVGLTLERAHTELGDVDILAVPHPATPGGTAAALLESARELLGSG